MDFAWKPEYQKLALQFLKLHFGDAQGITRCFQCMRNKYPWGAHRPQVPDARVPAKNNTEYHGLERHAMQYHAVAMYDYAYHHWLLAAFWRREDARANNFGDAGHDEAVQYCVKQALYNEALDNWQQKRGSVMPSPSAYGLSSFDVDNKERKARKELEDFHE